MTICFKELESLGKESCYEDALCKFELALEKHPSEKINVLRIRARFFARCNNHVLAVKDCETIFDTEKGTIRDYYLAAGYALSAGQFAQAAIWLSKVLLLGEIQNESWFKAAAYFLLAYSHMELRQYPEAIENLECAINVEPDVAMPIPSMMCGLCSHQQLREEIMRRIKSQS